MRRKCSGGGDRIGRRWPQRSHLSHSAQTEGKVIEQQAHIVHPYPVALDGKDSQISLATVDGRKRHMAVLRGGSVGCLESRQQSWGGYARHGGYRVYVYSLNGV